MVGSYERYVWQIIAFRAGAFAFDYTDTGFWVIHSIPKLSYTNLSYVYPKTGYTYGQHFLCVTLEKKYLESLSN